MTVDPRKSKMLDKRYVAGFLMKGNKVLLVRKNRPDWQAGLLNGIGGLMESGESPINAMHREFVEETGNKKALSFNWELFAKEEGPGYVVFFFRATLVDGHTWEPSSSVNDVGEELTWQPMNTKEVVIGNLNWLLPLCLDPRAIQVMAYTDSNIREIKTW